MRSERMKSTPVKKRMEFSKKMLIASYSVGVVILIFAMVMQWLFLSNGYEGSSEIVVTLITGAFAEMGIVTSMYSWKAKMENKIKLQAIYRIKDDDIEEENI